MMQIILSTPTDKAQTNTPSAPISLGTEEKLASHHNQVQGEMMLNLQTKKKPHLLMTITVTPNQLLYWYLTILTLHQDDQCVIIPKEFYTPAR